MNYRKVSDEALSDILIMYRLGIPTREISEKHSINPSSVIWYAHKHGIERPKGFNKLKWSKRPLLLSDEEMDELKSDFESGVSMTTLVKKYKIQNTRITKYIDIMKAKRTDGYIENQEKSVVVKRDTSLFSDCMRLKKILEENNSVL